MQVKDINGAMVCVLSGSRSKHTKDYIFQLMEFMKNLRFCSIMEMEMLFYEKLLREGSYDRIQILKLQGNYSRRLKVVFMRRNNFPLTRTNWEEAYRLINRHSLDIYFEMMEDTLTLPREWCDDEHIGEVKSV